jgi:hypothetical protein
VHADYEILALEFGGSRAFEHLQKLRANSIPQVDLGPCDHDPTFFHDQTQDLDLFAIVFCSYERRD